MSKQFDETKYAGPEHLDPDYVAKYDSKARTDPTADVKHLKDFGLGADSVVADLGAGSGTFAVAIAPHCKKVIAVDVSPATLEAMLDQAGFEIREVDHRGNKIFSAYSCVRKLSR